MTRRVIWRGVAGTVAVAAIGTAAVVAPQATASDTRSGDACHGRAATITGTDGDDVLTGTGGPDVIAAGDGDDTVRGLGGADLICGGDGDDTLLGGLRAGVYGGFGDDTLTGGRVEGSRGEDHLRVVLTARPSTFRVDGGPDDDRVDFVGAAAAGATADVGLRLADSAYRYRVGSTAWSPEVALRGVETMNVDLGDPDEGSLDLTSSRTGDLSLSIAGAATAHVVTGAAEDFLRLDVADFDVTTGGGNDYVNAVGFAGGGVIRTGPGFDVAFAGDLATEIYGGPDNDYLGGGPADDVLHGEAGGDFLLGQGGDDRLLGGADFDGVSGGDGTDYCRAEQRFGCEE